MGKPAEPEEKVGFVEGIGQTLSAFGTFIYDSENGLVMGRNGKSWARISVFYLFYYAFLACLFALSINITMSCMPKDKPYFQTRLQAPGVVIQPKLPSATAQNSDIRYSIKSQDYEKYTEQLDSFLEPYQASKQEGEGWKNCTVPVDVSNEDQDYQVACKQDISQLGLCSGAGYGYADGQPCLLLKVNKIIDWTPISYTNIATQDNADNREVSKAPSLQDFLTSEQISYNKDLMYISCYGLKDEDKENLGQNDETVDAMTYFPDGKPGIPFWNYPYLGKEVQGNYLSPVIAVKFNNVKKGVEINVGCKAYSLNILDDQRTNAGYIHFKMQIDE